MKMITLPKAPIQIQRDALLVEVEELKKALAGMEKEIKSLKHNPSPEINDLKVALKDKEKENNILKSTFSSEVSHLKDALANKEQKNNILKSNFLSEVAQLKNTLANKEHENNILKSNSSSEVSQLRNSIFNKQQENNVLKSNFASELSILKNILANKEEENNILKNNLVYQVEQTKVLQNNLQIIQANNNNNYELNLLKEQLDDKKSIIKLIKSENNTFKFKVDKLKSKLCEYTSSEISSIKSKILNNTPSLATEPVQVESIFLSGEDENND